MSEVVLIEGARTAFGRFGGSFKEVTATELAAHACKAALNRAGVDPDLVDAVFVGNVMQTSSDAAYIARHAALQAGVPIATPALTVNRLCGSGLQAIISAAQSLLLKEARVCLAGGSENMSQAPHVVRNARWGLPLGSYQLDDMLWDTLVDSYCGLPMAITAENLAERYSVSRLEQDEFALRSHTLAIRATDTGRLAKEIVPLAVEGTKPGIVQGDEIPRRDTSLEALAKLAPRFKKGGTVTAGNASGISDGAAALVVTTDKVARELGLTPMARLVSWSVVGVEPSVMGIGPAPAIRQALTRASLRLEDMELIEINEAFAAQTLAVLKELGIGWERVNVNGGAIALGHPLGASGARLVLTLAYELRDRGMRYGVAALCIGGGQGIAAVLENLQR